MKPILYIIIPCFNEQEVLPITAPEFLQKLMQLIEEDKISKKSRILFVNDGSKDNTWDIIVDLANSNEHYMGVAQSRNRGHQNAVLAGLMYAKDLCDITISIDCDGQDDINAMDKMVEAYNNDHCEVVYGVRQKRTTDTFFKRFTAESFYKLLHIMTNLYSGNLWKHEKSASCLFFHSFRCFAIKKRRLSPGIFLARQ